MAHLRVSGKGEKTRYVPLHPAASGLFPEYLDAAGHGTDNAGALCRPLCHNRTGGLQEANTPDGVYKLVWM